MYVVLFALLLHISRINNNIKRIIKFNYTYIIIYQYIYSYSISGHSITPYYAHKMYNATKTAITVLCEGLRHELSLINSKIKVSVSSPV